MDIHKLGTCDCDVDITSSPLWACESEAATEAELDGSSAAAATHEKSRKTTTSSSITALPAQQNNDEIR
ncbi:unnamed protein product [Didymodactylos carnosus]|uniref:Uncharacterized protein n=1 Tax=Didymodactylos carnosus TaxID=1234261 RepID=A0A816E0I8_9BILA|nr:unnamed protein product [Didymodactylos carnosus]CAF4559537.1 unnamed protein product [Didymodactylos carnosus]